MHVTNYSRSGRFFNSVPICKVCDLITETVLNKVRSQSCVSVSVQEVKARGEVGTEEARGADLRELAAKQTSQRASN